MFFFNFEIKFELSKHVKVSVKKQTNKQAGEINNPIFKLCTWMYLWIELTAPPPTKYTYGEGINMNNLPFAHKKKKKNWKDYHVYIDNYSIVVANQCLQEIPGDTSSWLVKVWIRKIISFQRHDVENIFENEKT